MLECQCRKCEKTWYGWAQTNICPHCGSELIQLGRNNHMKKEIVKKKTRTELSNT